MPGYSRSSSKESTETHGNEPYNNNFSMSSRGQDQGKTLIEWLCCSISGDRPTATGGNPCQRTTLVLPEGSWKARSKEPLGHPWGPEKMFQSHQWESSWRWPKDSGTVSINKGPEPLESPSWRTAASSFRHLFGISSVCEVSSTPVGLSQRIREGDSRFVANASTNVSRPLHVRRLKTQA